MLQTIALQSTVAYHLLVNIVNIFQNMHCPWTFIPFE